LLAVHCQRDQAEVGSLPLAAIIWMSSTLSAGPRRVILRVW